MSALDRLHDAEYPLPSPFATDGEIVLDEHDPFGAHRASVGDPPKGFCEVEILTFIRVGVRILIRIKRDGHV